MWIDWDGDSLPDGGNETGIPGVVLTLTLSSGVEYTTTTDNNGVYTFTNLSAGVYTVTVNTSTVPANYRLTTANPLTVTLVAGQVYTAADFGFQPMADLAIAKYDVPKVVKPGDTLTYTLRFENRGPGALSAITISEQLPPEVSGFSYITTNASLIISPTLTLTGEGAITDAVRISPIIWRGH